MRSITTLILFAIASGLGIWIYLDGAAQTRNPDNQESKVLTRFQVENIKKIHINSDGIETVISKHDDLWFFEKPVADRADQATTTAVLDLLTHLTIRDRISSEEIKKINELSDEKLGFSEEDLIQVTLIPDTPSEKSGSSQKVFLMFGKPAPMTNTIYARIKGENKKNGDVYIVDGNPRKYFEDPAAALRDQTLLFAPVNSLTGLSIRTADNTIKLERKTSQSGTEWSMIHPLPARANAELIEMIIAQLSSLQVESLLDSSGTSAASPNPVPEDGVVFELQLAGMAKPISVFLSPAKPAASARADKNAPPLLEARVSDRPAAFLVRSSLLQQVPPTANAFRDPYLARIPIQLLHSIIIQTRDNPNVILTAMPPSEGQIKWRSDRNGKREAANLTKIVSLVNAVNKEKILGFVPDSKADPGSYGLDHPFTAITFNIFQVDTASPDTNASVDETREPEMIQKTLKLGHSKDDANQLFASFVGEPYIYQISPAFQNRVSPHPLKWKAPKVLSFSLLSLSQIDRSYKDRPLLQLSYDYTQDLWSGKQGNVEITKNIDGRVAHKLASTLGSLTAQDWITTSQLAYQALNQPTLTLKIEVEEIDRALQQAKKVIHTLKFAPTATTGFYYGSLDSSPDVFIVDRSTFRDMVQSVTTNPTALRPGQ